MSDETTRNFNLTLTQISAGALAATVAAALGSRLGVAGTVVGAAFGSVTTSVVAAVYQHSLDRSRDRMRAIATARRAAGGLDQPAVPEDSAVPEPEAAAPATRRRVALALGVLAVFLVSLMMITGIETIRGGQLSGGGGTTVGKVLDGSPDGRTDPRPPVEQTTPSTVPTNAEPERTITPSTPSQTGTSSTPTEITTPAPLITESSAVPPPSASPTG